MKSLTYGVDARRSVSQAMDHPAQTPIQHVEVVLPSTLYLVVGETYRLNFANIVSGFDPSSYTVLTQPLEGAQNNGEQWEFVPGRTGSFTLALEVKDSLGSTLTAATRPIVVENAPSGEKISHLAIGDSITRAGGYVRSAVECVLRGKTVGTRTYNDGALNMEGRGGWTLTRYMTRIAQGSGGDSPFLFPVGVAGGKFLGNSSFWAGATVANPDGYDYDGFQMIARDWEPGGSYAFDASGYPASPTIGDVIVDPTSLAGTQWKEFSGTTWQTMTPQPGVELSVEKYMERFETAFSNGLPTSISIMLGTVDFLSALNDESWTAYRVQMDNLIRSIRAWNENVPIVLIGSPNGGPNEMWADQKVAGPEFNSRIVEHSKRLYAAYDTEAHRQDRVFVISFLGTVSDENMADYVHPKPEGHAEMAPWLAGVLAHQINHGAF